MFNFKKHYYKFILLFLLLISGQLANAQCAENIGFEDSTFAFWKGYINDTAVGCCPIKTPTGPFLTQLSTRFQVVNSTTQIRSTFIGNFYSGTDPFSGLPVVCPLPGFGTSSIKVGNDSTLSEAEKIRYTIVVTDQNADLVYAYAAVLENGGHLPADQPRVEAKATDQFGNSLACATFNIPTPDAANLPSGWFVSNLLNDVVYSNWTLTALNLRPYIGQTVILDFATGDCSFGGHFGYAYLDFACQKYLVINKYCPGDTVATLIAPTGFGHYIWDTIGTGAPPILAGASNQLFLNHPDSTIGYSVRLSAFATDSCGFELYDTVRVQPMPDADFYFYPNPACVGYPVTLIDDSKSNIPYASINKWNWILADKYATKKIDTIITQNITHTFLKAGDYYVRLRVNTTLDCISSPFFKRKVHVEEPSIRLSDSITICKNSGYQINFLADSVIMKAQWSLKHNFGTLNCNTCFDPVYTTLDSNILYVYITDNHGCTNTDSIFVKVSECPEIIVPSAFTPNGDKKNDLFFILDKKFAKLNYFEIFNRWGQLVYATTDLNAIGWDGTLNGKEQEVGTYAFKIMATDIYGNIKRLNGNVTLIR